MNRFHVALRTFGAPAFDFSVLEECPKDRLLERERFYIVLFNAASAENLNTHERPCAYPHVLKRSQASKDRVRNALLGRPKSASHRAAIRASRVGLKLSESHKRAIGAASTGRKFLPSAFAKQDATRKLKQMMLGPEYWDKRKPILAVDDRGEVLHFFESLIDAVAGLDTPNSSLRYYLRTGRRTPKGMFLFYCTVRR